MDPAEQNCDIGLIGLGTMGRNLALNIADHGFAAAVFNRTPEKTRQFMAHEAAGSTIQPGYDLPGFIRLLKKPRAILLLVSAGPPVDAMIAELRPHLEPGDLIIDSGNSFFSDTDRRTQQLAAEGLLFMGLGISGGEAGARYGPSLMPGGTPEAYQRVRPLLEAVAAKVGGEPCVAYLGFGSAGHYVKMVHNGIEYGLMQLIAETYDLMKYGLGLDNDILHEVYTRWSREEPASYLLEITARIFLRPDERTGGRLLDAILDVAGAKGTGVWTSREAMELQVPVPTIDQAVSMRSMSGLKSQRQAASEALEIPLTRLRVRPSLFLVKLKQAFLAGLIFTFAQGMALLQEASRRYGYQLHLEQVARIWRGGCIIRAAILDDIRSAYAQEPELANLLVAANLRRTILTVHPDLRNVVAEAVLAGIPVPGLAASLGYFDAYCRARLPAHLIQAQRDYFGAHTYARLDAPGSFHTDWQVETDAGR
ncbi:MAG: NADP-dependent phosphogluconate dehydrogenase [Deltaproteobacteria bacterium]|nr:NADP-dependent phosphogluconate dehydrogenase [Deltaproteobacteria bacterium]